VPLNKGIPAITAQRAQRTIWNAAVDAERHWGVYAGADAAEGEYIPLLTVVTYPERIHLDAEQFFLLRVGSERHVRLSDHNYASVPSYSALALIMRFSE
jgi:hypothetical protein